MVNNKYKIVTILIDYLSFIRELDVNLTIKRKCYLQLFNSQKPIRIFIIFFFIILNSISVTFFFKRFHSLLNKDAFFILNKLFKVSLIKEKVFELFLAVYLLQNKNREKKVKIFYYKKNYHKNKIYDAIVIGSGPAGSITSYFLKQKFNDILLLEEGHDTQAFSGKHHGDEFLYKWKNAGLNTTLFPSIVSYASGRCLGGGSEINSGLYHSMSKSFFEDWKKNFDVKFRFDDFVDAEKHFQKICNVKAGNQANEKNSGAQLFLNGIKKKNIKFEIVRKLQNSENERSGMKKTFIKKYIEENGEVATNLKAFKINQLKNFWEVETISKKKIKKLLCKRLFLCCGSINSTQLLLKSNLIEKSNNSFKFHPMIKVAVKFDKNIQNEIEDDVNQVQVTEYVPNYLFGNAASGKRFIDLFFSNCSEKKILDDVKNNWKKMAIYHSTFVFGKGKINNLFGNFYETFNISKININLVKEALHNLCDLLFESGAISIYLNYLQIKELNKKNYKDIISNISNINHFKFSSVHILGGITSGEAPKTVANSYGEIKKYPNLYVNDSSLINNNLLLNPQGTVMAIATNNIKKILND